MRVDYFSVSNHSRNGLGAHGKKSEKVALIGTITSTQTWKVVSEWLGRNVSSRDMELVFHYDHILANGF